MVQVDIPAAFAMGQVFAMVARKSLKAEPSLSGSRFLLLANLYTSLILAPTGMFLLVGWPGWETMYQWAWVEDPHFHPFVSLFYVAFLMAMVFLGNAGFFMTYRLLRADRDGLAKFFLCLSVACTLMPFPADIRAPLYIGTYHEYHHGQAGLAYNSPFFWSWLGIMLYWFGGSVAMVVKVYIEDKFRQHQLVR